MTNDNTPSRRFQAPWVVDRLPAGMGASRSRWPGGREKFLQEDFVT
jgi:hypothetical protein